MCMVLSFNYQVLFLYDVSIAQYYWHVNIYESMRLFRDAVLPSCQTPRQCICVLAFWSILRHLGNRCSPAINPSFLGVVNHWIRLLEGAVMVAW